MLKIIKIFFIILMTKCATEAKFKDTRDERIGLKESELIEINGIPDKVYTLKNIKYMEYKNSRYQRHRNIGYTLYCRITYLLDEKEGKVIKYTYEGNDCEE